MTEKRFELETFTVDCYVENLYVVKDNEKEMTEYQRHQRLTDKEVVDLLNTLHEENEQLKQQIKELQYQNNDVEWLRNNTVWEQMPTNRTTITKITYKR